MPRWSIAARAVLAVVLLVGFYALALGLVALLASFVYFGFAEARRIPGKLILAAGFGAVVILWSLRPRLDRFQPPGPRLREAEQPRLFGLIREVAAAAGQAPPVEVYLTAEVNAFVAQRGGVMGFFSRRVMGLGLPLLQTLTTAELRAVLAHEFGHFHGGDTRLGPWVYKTRAAIGRTIVTLVESGSHILHKPFEWYGSLFLWVTHAVSRAQEYAADRLAAGLFGSAPLTSAFERLAGTGAAFGVYWRSEYVPAVEAGFRPPLAAGFAQFLEQDAVRALVAQVNAAELEGDGHDAQDTHPPLSRRIEAVRPLPALVGPDAPAPALTLLDDVPALETRLLEDLVEPTYWGRVVAVEWDALVDRAFAPRWAEQARRVAEQLGTRTLAEAPCTAEELRFVAARALGVEPAREDAQELLGVGVDLLFGASATALVAAGWRATTAPGAPIVFERDGVAWRPFPEWNAVARGETTPEAWRARLTELGVAALPLAAPPPADAATPAVPAA